MQTNQNTLAGCQTPPGRGTTPLPQSPGPGPRQPRWAGWAWSLPGSDTASAATGCPPCSRHVRPGRRDEAPRASEGSSVQRGQAARRGWDGPRRQTLPSAELEPPIPERDAWQPHAGFVVRSGLGGQADGQLFTVPRGKGVWWLVLNHLEFSSSQSGFREVLIMGWCLRGG